MAKGANDSLWQALLSLPVSEDGVSRFPDKGWLQGWNTKMGMSTGWASSTLAYWNKTDRIAGIERNGRAIVGVRLAAHQPVATEPAPAQPEQVTDSAKQRVLGLLQKASDSKGRVRLADEALRKEVGLDYHDFAKVVWDLKKDGLLQFRERKVGSKHEIYGFQLRGKGMPSTVNRMERATRADTVLATEPWEICPECYWGRRWHRVAPDDDQLLICPYPPKPGSPREQGKQAEPAKPKPAPKPDRSYTKPSAVTYRCLECQPPRDFTDPASLRMHKADAHKPEVQPEPVVQPEAATVTASAVTDTASTHIRGMLPVAAGYPAIRAMLAQRAARMQAVKALEAAGEDDMALQLLGKVEEGLSPVEQEALRLGQALGWDEE